MGKLRSGFIGGFACLCLFGLVPASALAGTISGTVTAEGGGPVQGVEVCPTPQPYTFEVDCTETNAAGHYALTELPGSDYYLRFSAWRNNLPYVSEFYDDVHDFSEAKLAHLDALQALTVDAALAAGGSIAGSVSDEGTKAPISGIWVCATDHEGTTERCAHSGDGGSYVLNGLPSGKYSVEFEGTNLVSYLHEFYEDAPEWAAATDVSVTAPTPTAGIDAELAPGAGISGRVTDPVTGAPAADVFVCANEQPPGEFQGCAYTHADGTYAIGSLPAGTYLVAFELGYYPGGLWAEQWWNGAATMAEADPIELAPPEARSGIDGQATGPVWPATPEHEPQVSVPPPPPAASAPRSKPLPRCRRGFRRKLVKGKRRCVRKHRHRRQRPHNRR